MLALLSILLFAAACNQGADQKQPVTTKTDAGTSTAPPAGEVKKRNNALLRFIHTIPGVAPTDLFANDTKAFANVAYKTVTPYQELRGERQTFRLRLAGQDAAEPLVEDNNGFAEGEHYTVLALPTRFNKSALLFVKDDLEAPSSGKAKLRLLHAALDLGDVDLFAAGRSEALLKSADFAAGSKYTEVDPFSGTLEVRRENENLATLAVPNARFDAGKIYTIILVGQVKGTSKLEAMIVEDQLGGTAANSNSGD